MSWKDAEKKVYGEDDFTIAMPENYEAILSEFLSTMITSIQNLSSIIRGFPQSKPEEEKRKKEDYMVINDLRLSYSTLARWNRLNGSIERNHISGKEYWDFVAHVNVFLKMYKIAEYPSELSLTGYTPPPKTTETRRKVVSAMRTMQRKFAEPVFQQIEEQRKAQSIAFQRKNL